MSREFGAAMDSLAALAEARRTAVFCSEEDPYCLPQVGPAGSGAQRSSGYIGINIRGDGSELRAFVPKPVDEPTPTGQIMGTTTRGGGGMRSHGSGDDVLLAMKEVAHMTAITNVTVGLLRRAEG